MRTFPVNVDTCSTISILGSEWRECAREAMAEPLPAEIRCALLQLHRQRPTVSLTGAAAKVRAQMENVFLLARIGKSLRWETDDIGSEELPENFCALLGQLKVRELQRTR